MPSAHHTIIIFGCMTSRNTNWKNRWRRHGFARKQWYADAAGFCSFRNAVNRPNNFVYIYDSSRGFTFWLLWQLTKPAALSLPEQYGGIWKTIYGFSNGKLLSYQPLSFSLKEYVLPDFISHYTTIKAMNNKPLFAQWHRHQHLAAEIVGAKQ